MSWDTVCSFGACEDESALVPAPCAPQPLSAGPDALAPHPLLDVSLTPEKGILRRESSDRRRGHRQVRFDVSESKNWSCTPKTESLSLGPLELPRMHSTNAMKQEVRREAEQEFDAESAVRRELGRSYRARHNVESEAARALNVCRVQSLYRGLVNVEPPAEHLQRLAERLRKTELKQVTAMEGPDQFAFSRPCDHFTETPYLGVDGLPPLTHIPLVRPSHCSFNMFHKLSEWAS